MPREKTKLNGAAEEAGPGNDQPITKMDMVRKALSTLGNDAMPLAIQEYLKREFNTEMSPNMISNYKSNILGAQGKRRRRGRKKKAGRKAAEAAAPAVAAPAAAKKPAGISVDDVMAIKNLADRIGADKVKALADVVSKK